MLLRCLRAVRRIRTAAVVGAVLGEHFLGHDNRIAFANAALVNDIEFVGLLVAAAAAAAAAGTAVVATVATAAVAVAGGSAVVPVMAVVRMVVYTTDIAIAL